MAKFYIATTLSKYKDHNKLRDLLINQGHEITYDWTLHECIGDDKYVFDKKDAKDIAIKEINGVLTADILILLLPGKKGSHIELGAALANNKPIIMHSENENDFLLDFSRCIFYFHHLISRVVCPFNNSDMLFNKINEKLSELISIK